MGENLYLLFCLLIILILFLQTAYWPFVFVFKSAVSLYLLPIGKKLVLLLFWLHWLFIATHGLSVVAARGASCLVAVRGFLVAVASPVEMYEL